MDEKKELIENSAPLQPQSETVPDIDIPTLRTYKGDINQTVHKDKITTAKILMAEQRRQDVSKEKQEEVSVTRPTNIIALFFGVVFILATVGIIGYFGYTKIIKQTFNPITVPDSFLFVFDQEKLIDSSKNKTDIFLEVEKNIQEVSKMKDGTFTDLVFFKTNKETKTNTRITGVEFLNMYQISVPTNISRSISKDFVYGLYKTNGRVEPFLVFELVDYELTYSSMFIWESTLALDIKELFPILKNLFDITKRENNAFLQISTSTIPVIATTTSTTSKASSTQVGTSIQVVLTPEQEFQQQIEIRELINRTIRFTDVVFSNKDVRAVRDPKGTPFFYYAFMNRDKILFAQDPKLIGEISRKINEKSLVR